MLRYLMVVGCQREKLERINKRDSKHMIEWIQSHIDQYDRVVSVVRKDLRYDNFNRMGDVVANKNDIILDYRSDQTIIVPGYDVDCTSFPENVEYDIMGISTSASVLCTSMSMFSQGLRIHVLTKLCADRMGEKYHKYALEIMKAYMPIALDK